MQGDGHSCLGVMVSQDGEDTILKGEIQVLQEGIWYPTEGNRFLRLPLHGGCPQMMPVPHSQLPVLMMPSLVYS